MDFNHSDERRMLQDTLHRYLSDNYDASQRANSVGHAQGFSEKIWSDFAELGVIGALFAEEHGGFGGSGFDIAVVFEELGRFACVEPLMASGVMSGRLLSELGTEEQKALIGDVIDGELKIVPALEEPQSRYDLDVVETTAERVEDGYRLNGTKSVVIGGPSADKLIVSARGADGLQLFMIDADASGVERYSYPNLDGYHASDIALVNVVVPASACLGASEAVLSALEAARAAGVIALCAEAVGAMEAAKDLTVEYLRVRTQFGRALGKFQALQHRMSTVLIEIEQARSALINVAGHLSAEPFQRDKHVSAAKNLIGRVAQLVCEETIQLHGGIGMTEEYALGHYAKRLMMIDHQLGDVDYHLERFVGAMQREAAREAMS
ncbi:MULTISPECIES: acyl-CoA dehydrogenase family protein [unclassified Pseudovibrio]|uniref:acyl-CoA dehydrogenase family protein n=2 Tax=Pseudovibrio TaxID=258255 RepID=UPI0007AE4DC0|nr:MULTISPECIES: acyl-CoA dehydrogenase family protein [unclassified Pseudovibrio]KZL00556.1 Acyl-CoA dehydrogenase [Pseudovibrio sp. W74]KZL07731.1 Acyl-CoA dehydrogenase [Pseudovibrio sp. Ad14]